MTRLVPDIVTDRRDSKRGELKHCFLYAVKADAEYDRKAWGTAGYRTRITARSVRADRAEAFLYVLTVREMKAPNVSEASPAPDDAMLAEHNALTRHLDKYHGHPGDAIARSRLDLLEREMIAHRMGVSEGDGSGYMLDPTRFGVVREGGTVVRGLTAFAIRFAVEGGEPVTWIRFARDRYDASESAAEAIQREWPAATFFEIQAVWPTKVRGVHESPASYRARSNLWEVRCCEGIARGLMKEARRHLRSGESRQAESSTRHARVWWREANRLRRLEGEA